MLIGVRERVFFGSKCSKQNIDAAGRGSMIRCSTSTCGVVGVAHETLSQTGGCSVGLKEEKEL
jgi:hypothetical protein